MNEVSTCTEINCSSFNNLRFSLEDVKIEIFVLKATVRKLLDIDLDIDDYVLNQLNRLSDDKATGLDNMYHLNFLN